MPLDDEQVSDLQSLIAVARKRPLNFGLCLGKEPEETVLKLHRTRSPDVLGKQAKKDGSTVKMAFGVVEVKGKVMSLSCQEDPPPALARQTRLFLRLLGLKMKVNILDGEGNLLEADGDEEEEAAEGAGETEAEEGDAGDGQEAADGADPLLARWIETNRRLGARFVALGSGEAADKLRQAFVLALGAAEKADWARALDIAARVEAALERLDAAPAQPELAAAWRETNGRLGPRFVALGQGEAADKLRQAFALAIGAADKGDFAKALEIAARVEAALEKLGASPAQPAQTAADDGGLGRLREALAKLADRAKPLIAGEPDRRGDVVAALGAAKAAIDAGDAGAAREALFDAGVLLNAMEERQKGLMELQARLPVSLALADVNWREASSRVAAQIETVRDAVLAEIDDADAGAQAKKLDRLAAEIGSRGAALADAMAAVLVEADAAARAGHVAAAARLVDDYLAYLDGSALLAHLVGHPLDGGDEPEHATLLHQPLAELARNLAAAAKE